MLSLIVYTLTHTFGVLELLCINLHPGDGGGGERMAEECEGKKERGEDSMGLTIEEKNTAVSR